MDAVSFWDMTYAEISAAIEGFNKRQMHDMRAQAVVAFRQADLLATLISKVFGGKQAAPAIQEAFPGIFPELERQAEKQQNWQLMKARIEAYAAEKRKRGEARGNNAGRTTDSDNV
ncbi:hypothetical protein [Sporosarcina limicola]|uniref:Uncharacterized protein n=1 Tax=Sporosarcina limicola TaxID=34101 RepID=A0A927MHJ4_9BACL|nr:hypothetical protein [Sporosarcina limicola]MBE1554809.1 hypothetical protein [Sporosarcina limicola]